MAIIKKLCLCKSIKCLFCSKRPVKFVALPSISSHLFLYISKIIYQNRNATNLRRKVLHASFGLFFASLNHFLQKETFVAFTGSVSVLTLALELLRYRKGFGWMNNIMHWILGSSLRKHEMDGKFTGSLYYFTGVCMTSYLFPKTCATLGICQLALADPSASYFGRATRHIYWSRIEK